ncbi:MAG: TolC family protein [Thermoplasmatota archaeon]
MALAGVMITGAGSSISECHAQQHLTLSQALELAQDRNTEIQRQQNQVALEANAVDQARAAFRPNLSLSVGSSTDLGRSFDETAGRLETRRSQRLSFRASSSMTLYDGSARQSELRVARLGLDVAEGDLKRTGGRIAYLTASQYLRTVAATKLIRVAEENLESQRLQLDRIQAYWEQGVRSHTDVLQQEAALASAELSLLNARQTRDAALLQLKELLGMGPGTSLELVDVELETEAPPEAGSVDQLVRAALEQRLEIRSQELLIEAAELGVSSARAQKLPSVGLSVSGGTSYSSTGKRMWKKYTFERIAGIFGTVTGTVPSGLLLVRILDPEFKTPVAIDLGLTSIFAAPFVLSGMLLVNAPVLWGWSLELTILVFAVMMLISLLLIKILGLWGKPQY